MTTTQYVRPPRQRKPAKQAKPVGDLAQIRKFLWRHRDDMAPVAAAVVILLVALIAQPYPLAPALLILAGVGVGGLLYVRPWSSAPRAYTLFPSFWTVVRSPAFSRRARSSPGIPWEEKERAYAGALAVLAGLWAAWFAMGGVRPLVAYPFVVVLASVPWWMHHRSRHHVPVSIAKELTGAARRRAQNRTRQIIDGWDVITRQGRIPAAKILGITWDRYSLSVDAELKGGMSRRTLNYQGYSTALESAFDAPEDSFRAMPYPGEGGQDKKARRVRLRFLLIDPNATPLGRPTDTDPAQDIVGRFETGEPVVYMEGVHTGVFGMSGAGKSGLMNTLIRKFRKKRNKAMIGIDLKPGAPEFSPWGNAWYFLADTPQKAEFALQALIRGLDRRGEVMKERGWRNWPCTPQEPGVALFVDEFQEAKEHGLVKYLERLAGISRAYGFEMILATQHPVDKNLPTTIYNALRQVFGLKVSTKADRVVFGETANQDGWMPSRLPDDGGRYLVRSPSYRQPIPARGYWMTDDDVAEENAKGLPPVQLDPVMGHAFLSAGLVDPVDGDLVDSSGRPMGTDIVDAEVVDDPRAPVLEAVRDGIGSPMDIHKKTGIPLRTVKLYLAELAKERAVYQDAPRKPWRTLD